MRAYLDSDTDTRLTRTKYVDNNSGMETFSDVTDSSPAAKRRRQAAEAVCGSRRYRNRVSEGGRRPVAGVEHGGDPARARSARRRCRRHEPLAILGEEEGEYTYYLQDGLGSVTGLVDSTGTRLLGIYDYAAFGGERTNTISLENRYRYTSREFVENDLYYYRARYMRPDLGRFMSMDPKDVHTGSNSFAYVINNPVKHIDPYGLDVTCPTPEPVPGAPAPTPKPWDPCESIEKGGFKQCLEDCIESKKTYSGVVCDCLALGGTILLILTPEGKLVRACSFLVAGAGALNNHQDRKECKDIYLECAEICHNAERDCL